MKKVLEISVKESLELVGGQSGCTCHCSCTCGCSCGESENYSGYQGQNSETHMANMKNDTFSGYSN